MTFFAVGYARMGRHPIKKRPREDPKHGKGPPRPPRSMRRTARKRNSTRMRPINAYPPTVKPGHSPTSADVTTSLDVDRSTQHNNSLCLPPDYSGDKVSFTCFGCECNLAMFLFHNSITTSITSTSTTSSTTPTSRPMSSRTGQFTTRAITGA